MDNKIQELTDKIYKEGVEKGNAQAEQILADAKKKAQEIEAAAKKESERMIAETQKQMEELKKNTISELQLYAGQSVEALKSEVATLITDRLATGAVEAATDDQHFMQQVILALVSEWAKKEELVIETEDAAILTDFFKAKAKDLLDKGVQIKQVNGLKTDFAISPADGSYKVTFGEAEFVNYFKEFLRPQLVEMLFASK
ncbi:MAG: hypothetical protein RR202_03065 [Bacteroidales bacterium]